MKQVHSANEEGAKAQLQNQFKPQNTVFKSLPWFLSLSEFVKFVMIWLLRLLIYDFSQPERDG